MPSVKQFNYDIAYALDYLIYTMNRYNSGERSKGHVILFVHIIIMHFLNTSFGCN